MDIKQLLPLPAFSWSGSVPREMDLHYFSFYGIAFSGEFDGRLQHKFGSLQLAGFDISTHYFSLPSNNKTVVVNHGYYDHAGLYAWLIRMLLQSGCNVLIYDLPGHGLSSGEQAGIESFDVYQQVLAQLMAQARPYLSDQCYLLGQSTGGAITMDYVLNKPDHGFLKVILMAPLVIPVHWTYVRGLLWMASPFVDHLPRLFSKNSHDEHFVHFVKDDDPLQSSTVKRSWGKALVEWQKHFLASPASSIPALLFQGDKDKTVDWRYNVDKITEKFTDLTVLMLPGAMHHLANEVEHYHAIMQHEITAFIKG